MSCEDTSKSPNVANSTIEPLESNDVHQRKYFALKQKCEQLQQTNEKLVNRIHQVKRILKRYKKEKRFVMARLDTHGDQYHNIQVPAMWEESEIQRQMTQSRLEKQEQSPSATTAQQELTTASDDSTSERLTNAFFMFSQQRTPILQDMYFEERGHDLDERKLVQRLTQEWNDLTSEARMVYCDMYDRDILKPKDSQQAQPQQQHTPPSPASSQLYAELIKNESLPLD